MLHIIKRKISYDPQNCDVHSMLVFARIYLCLLEINIKFTEILRMLRNKFRKICVLH
jgi:hypothetical protein